MFSRLIQIVKVIYKIVHSHVIENFWQLSGVLFGNKRCGSARPFIIIVGKGELNQKFWFIFISARLEAKGDD